VTKSDTAPMHRAPESREPVSASHIAGLSIALVATTVLWIPAVIGPLLPEDFVWRNVAAQGIDWGFAVVLILIVVFWERKPLASMGFKSVDLSVVATGLGLGGFLMVGILGWSLLAPMLSGGTETLNETMSETPTSVPPPYFFLWYAPFALITASFAEEIIYRGYAMERLLRIGVGPVTTVLVTQIAFALYHLKDGLGSVLMVATIGSLFAVYYVLTRNLWVTIIGHFFVDAMAILGHAFGIRPSF